MTNKRIFQIIILIIFLVYPISSMAEEELITLSDEESASIIPGENKLTDAIEKWRSDILKKYGTDIAFVLNTQYQHILRSQEHEGQGCWSGYYALSIKQKLFLDDFYLIPTIQGGKGKGIDRYTPAFSVFNDDANEPCWIYIPKFYFEKGFLDNIIIANIGKLDLSSWFDANHAAFSSDKQFLSSAFCNNRAIPFPAKGIGACARIKPNDLFYLQAGISNANAVKTMIGLSNAFSGAYFIMSELGICPKIKGKEGNYRFMLFGDVEKLQKIDGLGTQQNDFGFALSFDQNITENIILFFRYGSADPKVRKISGFLSAGAQVEGMIPGRNEDVWGIGAARSFISSNYRNAESPGIADAETIYETYYNIKLYPFFSIIPNLQYVTNPLGQKNVKDEFTAGVRFVVLI